MDGSPTLSTGKVGTALRHKGCGGVLHLTTGRGRVALRDHAEWEGGLHMSWRRGGEVAFFDHVCGWRYWTTGGKGLYIASGELILTALVVFH